MISVPGLICNDPKAYEICVKHINENIVAGIDMYKDNCDYDPDFKEEFETDECYAMYFPRDFAGSRYDAITRIKALIESSEIVQLSNEDKYILMHCLEDYYANDRFYVLSQLSNEAADICAEDHEKDGNVSALLEYLMGQVEDLTNYPAICFTDMDYEFLGDQIIE